MLCEILAIKRNSFYAWAKRITIETEKDKSDRALADGIVACYHGHSGTYGYRRIKALLNNKGLKVNHKRVYRIMRELGLAARIRRKKIPPKSPQNPAASNILNRDFKTSKPNHKMGTDVTTMLVCGVRRHLSVILDHFNHEVASYQVSKHNNNDLVIDTVKGVLATRDCSDMILHSDRGSQYRSYEYSELTADFNITVSMSAPGCPADNAVVECFFSHLKAEFFYLNTFKSEDDFLEKLHKWLVYYNNTRIQARLGYRSPVDYRLQATGN